MKTRMILIAAAVMLTCLTSADAVEYKLAVQPVLPRNKIKFQYQALADYLSARSGESITLSTFSSFKSYFANMKRKRGFDMVLDAAHFTDYRIKRMGYTVLAKSPGTVSFSLVTDQKLLVFDADELIPYRVATMISPAMGGLRLKELYPDRSKSPVIVRASDSVDAVTRIKNGQVEAAMIPTPLVGRYENLNTVLTTDPVPHTAFSVSPEIPAALADIIRQALTDAANTREGREMLATIGFTSFVSASNEDYDGHGDILQITARQKPVLSR